MRHDFNISAPGPTAISPNAGYCNATQQGGDDFKLFLGALLDAHFKAKDLFPAEINVQFIVGGLLQSLNRFALDKQPAVSKPAQSGNTAQPKDKKAVDKEFSIKLKNLFENSTKAYENGKKITADWFCDNSLPISEIAIQCVEKEFTDLSVRNGIKIQLFDPSGIDQFPIIQPERYNPSNPSLVVSIRVEDWEVIWRDNKNQFISDLARMLRYFERGRLVVKGMIESGGASQLKMSGLDSASAEKLERNYIQLDKLPKLTEEDEQFLCESLGFKYSDLLQAFESFDKKPQNQFAFDAKSRIAFTRISLAALEYFSRHQEKKFTPKERKENSDSMLSVFKSNQMFMLAETTSFAWFGGGALYPEDFSKNILYPKPKALDVIQGHVVAASMAVHGIEPKFTVRYRKPENFESMAKDVSSLKEETHNNSLSTTPSELVGCLPSSDDESTSSNSDTASNHPEKQVDQLIVDANKAMRALIKDALKRKTDPLFFMKLLNKFIEWHHLSLVKICASEISTEYTLNNETSFWLTLASVLDHIEKIPLQKDPLLIAWQENVRKLSEEKTIPGNRIKDIQEYAARLDTLFEKTNTLLAVQEKVDGKLALTVEKTQNAIDSLEESDTSAGTELRITVIDAAKRLATKLKPK